MEILGKNIKAVIFDMDGTLIDSTFIWNKIDMEFFARRGFDKVPVGYAEEIVHMGLQQGAIMTINRYGLVNDTVEGVIKEWNDASIEQYEKYIPLKPYAIEILEYFKNKGIKIALATANAKSLYEPCIKRLDIEKYFDFIIDVDQVKEGKSSAKIYNIVSDKLMSLPEETLVLEDSLAALKTAFQAGYITIGVDDLTSRNVEEEKRKLSYKYIYSLKELIDIN